MLELTNTAAQTLTTGQAITFDGVLLQTGNGECSRSQSGRFPTTSALLNSGSGIYAVSFYGNIGATAPGTAQLQIELDGTPLPETTMLSVTAAAGNLNNVAASTRLRTGCRCSGGRVSVVNTGGAAITIGANSTLIIERRA